MSDIIGLLAIAGLVLMNGFFVAAEISLVSARRTRIDQLAEEGKYGAIAARHAIKHLDSYIAATQLGITLASLGLGWLGESVVGHLIEQFLIIILPPESAESLSHTLAFPVSFSIVTMLHIVIGELAPKSIAIQYPEGTSIVVAPGTRLFHTVFFPIIWLMNMIGNALVRLIGFTPASGEEAVHSPEELTMLFRASREAGMLQRKDEQLLMRAINFRDIPLENIMKPRVDIAGFPAKISKDKMMKHIAESRHSRYVIYGESLDDVLGNLTYQRLVQSLGSEYEE